jgi:inner membrane protein
MDPLSQASLGASLSQSFAQDKVKQRSALIIGALAAMAPDLDVLIKSAEDPLLFLEYHRQFTHSLVFIPLGAFICALVFYPFIKLWPRLFKKKTELKDDSILSFAQIYLFSFLAYATHGLLDACTSYGTQLFWPFSTQRIAWNTVSIIDPLFTLPIVMLILMAAYRQRQYYAKIAFVYALVFLSMGMIQKERALSAASQVALQRGHQVERVQVKPSFANRHVWKVIYEYDGRYYVDAVKLLWNTKYIEGTSIQKLNLQRDFPWLSKQSQQAKDIERFRWFSGDYLAISKDNPNLVIDVRYSFIPNQIQSMWGVGVNRESIDAGLLDHHVTYQMRNSPNPKVVKRFMEMVF